MRILLLAGVLLVAGGAPGEVQPTDSLSIPRAAHTATLLADGSVLIAGGCTAASCELEANGRTTEIYFADDRAFAAGPPLSRPRVGHAAVRLREGRVLVAGGWEAEGLTRSAEIFDPGRRRFAATGSLAGARGGFTATLLADGRVLFAGGARDGRALASTEIYDPRTGRFTAAGAMFEARAAHAAVRLRDGRVLVVGGSRAGEVLRSAEVFDPSTERWSRTGKLRAPRQKHGAVLLRDGRVLVVGGSDARDWRGRLASAELWHPRTGRFVPVAAMTTRRFKLTDAVVRVPSGRVAVAGGSDTVETFDPGRRRFETAGRFDRELFFATATVLRNGQVLIVGGYDGDIAISGRAWLLG